MVPERGPNPSRSPGYPRRGARPGGSWVSTSPDRLPASLSIYTVFFQYGEFQLAAYSMLYSLPVVVLFLILSRKLGGAFALGGAIKG
jgi:hypothetical protein